MTKTQYRDKLYRSKVMQMLSNDDIDINSIDDIDIMMKEYISPHICTTPFVYEGEDGVINLDWSVTVV